LWSRSTRTAAVTHRVRREGGRTDVRWATDSVQFHLVRRAAVSRECGLLLDTAAHQSHRTTHRHATGRLFRAHLCSSTQQSSIGNAMLSSHTTIRRPLEFIPPSSSLALICGHDTPGRSAEVATLRSLAAQHAGGARLGGSGVGTGGQDSQHLRGGVAPQLSHFVCGEHSHCSSSYHMGTCTHRVHQ
jgi:hypothetical protein